MDKLQLVSHSLQYVFARVQKMAAGMGAVQRRPLNEKSSQLCCQLRVDWLPEDEGEELLLIERQDSPDGFGERLQLFECAVNEPSKQKCY